MTGPRADGAALTPEPSGADYYNLGMWPAQADTRLICWSACQLETDVPQLEPSPDV